MDALVGQRFEAKDGNLLCEFEVVGDPVLPSYGGDRLFVWAKALRAIPRSKGRPRKRPAKLRTTVFFLPLPNNNLRVGSEPYPERGVGTSGGLR